MSSAARAVPIRTTSGTTTTVQTILNGFGVAAIGGASSFNIRNGDGGTVVVPVTLISGESTSEVMAEGVLCDQGVYIEIVSGGTNLIGSVWIN